MVYFSLFLRFVGSSISGLIAGWRAVHTVYTAGCAGFYTFDGLPVGCSVLYFTFRETHLAGERSQNCSKPLKEQSNVVSEVYIS